jgi:hypothetical protein
MHQVLSPLVLSLSFAVAVPAQVVDTSAGTVEFLGLETTTPAQALKPLLDAAKGGRPHLCAASFLKAGFADASVRMVAPGGPVQWVVRLVEPAHKERVQRRPAPTGTCAQPPQWPTLRQHVEAPSIAFQVAMNWFGKLGADDSEGHAATRKAAAAAFGADVPYRDDDLVAAWTLLRTFQSAADQERALWTLRHDGDALNRTAAACILANFPDSDLAFWELADALTDGNGMVGDFAQRSLVALTVARARSVDWGPALPVLRRLLDGTNLFAFEAVVDVLCDTRVAPAFARQLVGGNGGGAMLLASARAVEPATRAPARRLLRHLCGCDHGEDWTAWQAWLRSL